MRLQGDGSVVQQAARQQGSTTSHRTLNRGATSRLTTENGHAWRTSLCGRTLRRRQQHSSSSSTTAGRPASQAVGRQSRKRRDNVADLILMLLLVPPSGFLLVVQVVKTPRDGCHVIHPQQMNLRLAKEAHIHTHTHRAWRRTLTQLW